jgi:hypothetical protein
MARRKRKRLSLINFDEYNLKPVIFDSPITLKVLKRAGISHDLLVKKTRAEIFKLYNNDLYGEELDYACKYHEKKRKERFKKMKAERKFIVNNRKAGLADDGG